METVCVRCKEINIAEMREHVELRNHEMNIDEVK